MANAVEWPSDKETVQARPQLWRTKSRTESDVNQCHRYQTCSLAVYMSISWPNCACRETSESYERCSSHTTTRKVWINPVIMTWHVRGESERVEGGISVDAVEFRPVLFLISIIWDYTYRHFLFHLNKVYFTFIYAGSWQNQNQATQLETRREKIEQLWKRSSSPSFGFLKELDGFCITAAACTANTVVSC